MRSGPLAASGVRKTATPTVAPALQPLQRRPDWPSSLESRPAGTVTEPGIHHAALLVVRSPAAIATRTASLSGSGSSNILAADRLRTACRGSNGRTLTASARATAGWTSGTMGQRDPYPHPTFGTGAGNVQVLAGLLAETEPLGLPTRCLGPLRTAAIEGKSARSRRSQAGGTGVVAASSARPIPATPLSSPGSF